jgi:apolipoprotein N-acyltransferase
VDGATLLGRVPASPPGGTLYTRTGDLFGWLCTAAAVLLVLLARRLRPTDTCRTTQTRSDDHAVKGSNDK